MTGVGRHTDANLIRRLDWGLKNKDSEQNCKNPSHAHPVRLWPPNAKTDLHVGSSLLVRLVLSKHLQTVSLLQLRHPVEEKRFVVAASDDLMFRATRLSASFEKLCDLCKVILEACRTDDLDDTRRFWAGVPKGVRDIARLVDICAPLCLNDLVTDPHPNFSLKHVGEFVLHRMNVWRNKPVRSDRIFDDCKPSTGLVAPHLNCAPRPPKFTDFPSPGRTTIRPPCFTGVIAAITHSSFSCNDLCLTSALNGGLLPGASRFRTRG